MASKTKPVQKGLADVQIGDILTPDNPPRCCGRDMEFFPGDETSDSVWDCWELLCENPVYVDSNGVVTDRA